jgi:DNA uptake protein ComE-like DNA-binding protein
MADTVNINTATMEQLKTIKNIGQIRVSLILTEREKKGQLNLTDLKLIEGISNTVWDTLVESGKIKIEPPEHEENVTEELPIWKNKCRR